MLGAFFGGCPNTTYGESVGCVAISGNASVVTILTTAILAIVIAFVAPFIAFLSTIPSCVMGGVCILLFGVIAASGIRVLVESKVDYSKSANLVMSSVIMIVGLSGAKLTFGTISVQGMVLTTLVAILMSLTFKLLDSLGLMRND